MTPLPDGVRRAAASAAGIAVATVGLSSCKNGGGIGIVDPPPPPLSCNAVSSGQSIVATASRDSDLVTITLRHVANSNNTFATSWSVTRVGDVSDAALVSVSAPRGGTLDSVVVVLRIPVTGGAPRATFTFEGNLYGYNTAPCAVKRIFTVTLTQGGVQVSQLSLDQLPLPARQRAEIVLASRDEGSVVLEAFTPFTGAMSVSWDVSAGELDARDRRRVRWTLPSDPGVYLAELALDYGEDGMSYDALMLEVTAAFES